MTGAMLKRLMDFLFFSTGITPKGHTEPDKWAKFRAEREAWERRQRELDDAPTSADRGAGAGPANGDAGGREAQR